MQGAAVPRCNLHALNTLSTKLESQRVLDAARLPACETALEIIERFNEDTCPTCGYPRHDTDEQRTVLAAIKLVLDRTGMSASLKLELTHNSDGDFVMDQLTPEQRARAVSLVAQWKALKHEIKQAHNPPAAPQPPQVM
jgi:hypothetical protein